MARMRERLDVPVMCAVGAAFDFHAGRISQAPSLDAGARPRVDLPDRPGAAPAAAALPLLQPALRAGVCAPVPAAGARRLRRMEASVAVIGLGRVGLPLALSFADRGLRTIGVEREQAVLDQLAAGQMPFSETGTQELLERVVGGDRLELTRAVQDAASADHIVLTLHTPSHVHIEIDISHVRGVVDDLLPVLREGHSLILRSTVAPGHDRVGRRLHRAAARLPRRRGPVRLARAGADRREPLPRGDRDAAVHRRRRRRELGRRRRPSCSRCSAPRSCRRRPVQAELAKIWTNILRYTQFALPNLLMMECEQYGANVFDVIELINHDYPRGGMAVPGLTAGACLRKDFTFSEERSSAPGMLLAVSRVHETVPLFLVKGLKSRLGGSLRDLKVAVLGLTLQARLRRPARLALLQARADARARAGPRGAPRPARARRVGAARRRRSRAPTRWSSPRTTRRSRACSSACPRARCSWTRGT